MTVDLEQARSRVEDFLAAARDPKMTGLAQTFFGTAVETARTAELIGSEYDTRMLSGVLSEALMDACQRDSASSVTLYGANLLAVLSDLADMGDEVAAQAVNECVAALPVDLVQYGRACAALRRRGDA